mgnify:CR=1 FL=1|jgi:hypothetical protein
MNITLKRTEEQVELVKAMASRNRDVAYEAQAAVAEFIGPVLAEVINNAPTLSNMFRSFQFNEDDNPSIPLDLYHDVTDSDYIEIYSQTVPGGLPSNTIMPTHSELKFSTYRMETALDFDRRYAARSRLDVVGKTFTRLAQELLIKIEQTSANLLLGVLANAKTNELEHVIASTNQNQFLLHDVNNLITRAKRLNTAWYKGGTPVTGTKGVTDLIVSPEIMGEIRAMAYNPLNTRGLDNSQTIDTSGDSAAVSNQGAGVIPGTEEFRNQLYRNAGTSELYGINLTELNELGDKQRFNDVYGKLVEGDKAGNIGHSDGKFNSAEKGDQLIIGIDRTRDSLIRAVATDSETGSELRLAADDQYVTRQSRIGYYGSMEEGRMVLDSRALTGIVV